MCLAMRYPDVAAGGRKHLVGFGPEGSHGGQMGTQATPEEIEELLSQVSREFEPWKAGITLEMVERLYCVPESFSTMRIQVVLASCAFGICSLDCLHDEVDVSVISHPARQALAFFLASRQLPEESISLPNTDVSSPKAKFSS